MGKPKGPTDFEMPKINKDALLTSQKKNLETFSEICKQAKDQIDSMADLQGEYLQETFKDMQSALEDVVEHPTSLELWQKHSNKMQQHFSRSLKHSSNVTEKFKKTQRNLQNIINKRVHESMKELHNIYKKGKH